MAVNPYDKAHELARAIADSEQYKSYIKAKDMVENDPKLKDRILEFRQKQMEVNRLQMMEEDIDQELIIQVAEEFAKLNQNKQIADFFTAEGSFITLFNDIQQIIHKKMESGF